MSHETNESLSGGLPLPDTPNLDWLRKQAKRRLEELRADNPDAQLADAQFDLAKRYGFTSWRALKAHIDSLTVEGQLFDAASTGDVGRLTALLDAHPALLAVRDEPYAWSLLHRAAHNGHLAAVNALLARGLDVNTREKGDNTYAMHWAAAAGHVDVVRRLIDAGGDVVGQGDDHELEVIGWATCWDGCDDDRHRAIVDVLVAHGARHHIFSAIAMRLGETVRDIVRRDPAQLARRMSRNENNQTPLHFAVRMNRPAMVTLLMELGADPLAADSDGYPAPFYATSPDVDRAVVEAIRRVTGAELRSAERGSRPARGTVTDLLAALALGDWAAAERLSRDNPDLVRTGGVLHLAAKRGDARAVTWLLEHDVDPNTRWLYFDTVVPPIHLAAWLGHANVVRALLDAGADPHIRDTKHDGDAEGWADHGGRTEIVRLLQARETTGARRPRT